MSLSESDPTFRRVRKAGNPSITDRGNPRRRPRQGRRVIAMSGGRSRYLVPSLIEELLQQVGALPIKTIIHGWPTESAKEFLAKLTAVLRPVDSFMLVPIGTKTQQPPAELERAFVVDLAKDSHKRTYENSTCEILFFSSLNKAVESALVSKFKERARVMVVDTRGTAAKAIAKAGRDAKLVVFQWSGGDVLEPYDERAANFNKSHVFVATANSEQSHQAAGTVHRCEWTRPRQLYVPLPTLPDGRKNSLVWRYVLDCVPSEYYEIPNVNYGEFCEILMPEQTATVIQGIAKVFDETIDYDTLSKSAFVGEVAEAMARVEMEPSLDELDLKSKPMESRKELLRSIGVGAL